MGEYEIGRGETEIKLWGNNENWEQNGSEGLERSDLGEKAIKKREEKWRRKRGKERERERKEGIWFGYRCGGNHFFYFFTPSYDLIAYFSPSYDLIII